MSSKPSALASGLRRVPLVYSLIEVPFLDYGVRRLVTAFDCLALRQTSTLTADSQNQIIQSGDKSPHSIIQKVRGFASLDSSFRKRGAAESSFRRPNPHRPRVGGFHASLLPRDRAARHSQSVAIRQITTDAGSVGIGRSEASPRWNVRSLLFKGRPRCLSYQQPFVLFCFGRNPLL